MKLLKLLILVYGGSFALITALCKIVEYSIGMENGLIVVIPLGLFIGLNARLAAEKILGYTVYEAMKD